MMDFWDHQLDVLVCSTIIENGLDIQNANTLIIYEADRLGLSQLYQLRGRVGRSNRTAYAYLTFRKDHVITEQAQKRLEAIREFTQFGAGFRIALRDLEIRGTGNLLGAEQHGQMQAVGYDMYCKLLSQAIAQLKGEPVIKTVDTTVELKVDAYLPEEFIEDTAQKMEIYKKIAQVQTRGDVSACIEELIDRFGDPPQCVLNLLDVALLRALAQRASIAAVFRRGDELVCKFTPDAAVDPDAERRLHVLEHHTELGAGYRIALKDLELRGAGNLLGPEQSGFVQAVGFDMYLRMLDDTVKRVMRGDTAPKLQPSDVSVDLPSYLPDEYVTSQDAKLDIYRRLTHMTDTAEIEALKAELRDRFGPLPAPAETFFAVAMLRVLGGAAQIESMLLRGNEARITFGEHAVPRMKGISAAFHEVQFQAEVRRAHPLSLKLTRLGGAELLGGLVRALATLRGLGSG
jgi:transcription-repair coupling factor (superfamily II helicase)